MFDIHVEDESSAEDLLEVKRTGAGLKTVKGPPSNAPTLLQIPGTGSDQRTASKDTASKTSDAEGGSAIDS